MRLRSGARVVLEASRVAVGEQNNYGFEVHGTRGAVSWDFRRMNELRTSLGEAYQDQTVTTVYVRPGHGEYAASQPGAANAMGFDDLEVIEAHAFLRSIADGTAHGATLPTRSGPPPSTPRPAPPRPGPGSRSPARERGVTCPGVR